jgi:RsiW-degrading membrane proteinase PrsW (M82 family)
MNYATLYELGHEARPMKGLWWRILGIGLIFYFVGVGLMYLTGNPNLFPTVMMVGSFMIPATYIGFFYEQRHWTSRNLPSTALSFIYGGLLGAFAASVLEPIFVNQNSMTSPFVVGLIEEFAKILGVLVIARKFRHNSALDGLVLGAAAGMGFAALESMGYAFTVFINSGAGLSYIVVMTLIRGILSPLGHGTWTAILVGVLFLESDPGKFRITSKVIGAYLLVSILHGLWDAIPMLLSNVVTSGLDLMIGQVVVGAVGLFILWFRWREAKRLENERPTPAAAAIAANAALAKSDPFGPEDVTTAEFKDAEAPDAFELETKTVAATPNGQNDHSYHFVPPSPQSGNNN